MIRPYLRKRFAGTASAASPDVGNPAGAGDAMQHTTSVRRPPMRRVGVLVALCLAGSAFFATTAQAAHVTKSGDVGTVYYKHAYAGYAPISIGPIVWGGISQINEAPAHAGYTQRVSVTFRVWDYHMDNYWPYTERWVGPYGPPVTVSGLIPASSTYRSGWDYWSDPLLNNMRLGFDVVIKWRIASTGQLIGTKIIDYDAGPNADLRCGADSGCTYNASIDWMDPN
jgi:hypothetical protein